MVRFFAIVACCFAFYVGIFFVVSWATDVGELKTQYAHVLYKGNGKAVVHIEKSRPATWASINDVSKIAVSAIVISEDDAFYQHNGYDPNQLREAFEKDMAEHRFARGGSTITQQVVKNVYLSGEKSLWRKAREIVLALRLERQVGKRRILETYLNVVEFGEGLYGIGPASRFYFKKEPRELTAKEGAFLAMLLPSPKRYSISFRKHALTKYARQTVDNILEKLHVTGRLTDAEYAAELAAPLSFEAPPLTPLLNPPLPVEEPEPADDDSADTTGN